MYVEKLCSLDCSVWRREGSRGVLVTALQCLMGLCKKAREGLLTRRCSDRTRENGGGKVCVRYRKKRFPVKGVRHWNMLYGEAVSTPREGVFKAGVEWALSNLAWWKVPLSLVGQFGTMLSLSSLPTQTIL